MIKNLTSRQLAQKWKEEELVSTTKGDDPMINVHKWLSRTTLDVIGKSEPPVHALGFCTDHK